MSDSSCGCCSVTPAVPQPTDNPPQQDALRRRIGTHGSFLAALVDGLSATPALEQLTTHAPADPTLALCDAWACVADVLTFYQERFANETYLRTATERRSVLQLGRLVGSDLRPGVAASVPLAFTLDATDPNARSTIPAGTAVQSLPGPGELPQTFETSDDLPARAQWNVVPVRQTRGQALDPTDVIGLRNIPTIYFAGVSTNLRPGDAVLLVYGAGNDQGVVRRVSRVQPDPIAQRTLVTLDGAPAPAAPAPPADIRTILNRLDERVTVFPRPVVPSDRTLAATLRADSNGDVASRLLIAAQPALRDVLYQALQNQPPPPAAAVTAYVFRMQTGVFAANANVNNVAVVDGKVNSTPWDIQDPDKLESIVWLDTPNSQIQPGSYVFLRSLDSRGRPHDRLTRIKSSTASVAVVSRSDYNVSARTTRLEVVDPWFGTESTADFWQRVRQTTVCVQAEPLDLAEEPIPDDDVNAVGLDPADSAHVRHTDRVELQEIAPDLEAGRLAVFSGERMDLPGVTGIQGAELVRIAAVEVLAPPQSPQNGKPAPPPLDQYGRPLPHRISVLHLDAPLVNTYRRSTLKIYANVVMATHGESRTEVLGGGDASEAWSSYTLRQFPVTRLPAPTPEGSMSTLEVRVHGVLWHEVDRLSAAGPLDHVYETQTGDDARTTVIFGDGVNGARPATDRENITAALRVGLGLAGNVLAGQLSLLPRPPAGVLTVTNPLAASGGADPEGRDRARRNAPLGTLTLDRLVSVPDYAAFARTFAGIGKAEAAELTDGRRRFVHVTVAGSDDVPLAPQSDLLVNLRQALARAGDAREPIQVDPRERVLLILQAGIRSDPDYQWADIDLALRQALVQAFPFENRGMGRDMFTSEVIAALQSVLGVLEVEIDVFAGIPERVASGRQRLLQDPSAISQAMARAISDASPHGPQDRVCVQLAGMENGTVRPAQIAYFGPETLDVLKGAVVLRRID